MRRLQRRRSEKNLRKIRKRETMKTEVEFEGSGGVVLRGEGHGNPCDPPVVLLHGAGQRRFAWSNTCEILARKGWYAVALDLRGHGDSDWAPDGDYDRETLSADVAAVALSFELPPVLVGASLGGISSLLALGSHGEGIASALVLVDIATRTERSGASRVLDFMSQKPEGFESLEEAADAISSYNPHRPRPKDPSGLKKNLRLADDGRWRWHWDPVFFESLPRFGQETTGAEASRTQPLDEAARGLTLPTLLVRGRTSDLLSEEGAREFLKQVPHAKFSDVSGAGHMVAGDRNDIFCEAVLGFLHDHVRHLVAK